MENLNYINPLLHGIVPEEIENKVLNLSSKQLVCAGVGTLIAGALLKKAGHQKTGAMIAGLALPILATAIYKKVSKSAKDKRANAAENDNESVTEHA